MSDSPLSSRLYPNGLKSIDSATFTGSYQAVGTALTHSVRIIKFTNNSNVLVTLSWDGVNDHEALPAGSFLLLDVSANREMSQFFEIANGTQFYAKGSAGTGLLYISSYFGA